MALISIRAFGDGADPGTVRHDLDAVSELLDDGAIVWIDLQSPDASSLQLLADELGLHHLAVEDALDVHQRDKYVHYEDHMFLVCRELVLAVEPGELVTREFAAFVSSRWLVTVHSESTALVESVAGRFASTGKSPDQAVAFILYGVLDAVLDGYYDVLDGFRAYYDATADQVFGDVPIEPKDQRRWFEMRKALNEFDRIVRSLDDALGTMVNRDLTRFPESAGPYLRDVAGEISQVHSEVFGLRELERQTIEVNMMLRDYRQNVVMKKVTSWAAIIAVPTLVTGFYGMNVPYPGSGETWGVVAAAGLSVAASGGLYLSFRRRGWL